jgi:hypothetical protein
MKDWLAIGADYSCVLGSVGSDCLKWKVGFNTEVAEGTRRRAGIGFNADMGRSMLRHYK